MPLTTTPSVADCAEDPERKDVDQLNDALSGNISDSMRGRRRPCSSVAASSADVFELAVIMYDGLGVATG